MLPEARANSYAAKPLGFVCRGFFIMRSSGPRLTPSKFKDFVMREVPLLGIPNTQTIILLDIFVDLRRNP
jgi:hypothetical protein